MSDREKITPCLWFDNQAEEAMNFYTSIFPGSKVLEISRAAEGTPGIEAGSVLTVRFQLAGREFMGLNGGPEFTFNEAISLSVDCEDQAEVDRLWDTLTADGGEESQCGWLKDKYGLSWQIVPRRLMELLGNRDAQVAARTMQAMLQMRKINVAELEAAAAGS